MNDLDVLDAVPAIAPPPVPLLRGFIRIQGHPDAAVADRVRGHIHPEAIGSDDDLPIGF